jgi:oxidase EvaA
MDSKMPAISDDKVKSDISQLKANLKKVLNFGDDSTNLDFYISAITENNPYHTTDELVDWLRNLNKEQFFYVDKIPLSDMEKWYFDDWTGNLHHQSGGFFSIRGLKVKTNIGNIGEWTQPIIHQPEIGVLGIITKKINGILYFLMQAKAEPGNLNTFQLSPSVQATRSNYLRKHGGKPTLYLEYFLDRSRATVLFDQLQSEQGARFYHKRNRNIIVRVPDDEVIEESPNHKWFTLGQIISLMNLNNTVNMDTRSIVAGIDFAPKKVNSHEAPKFEDLKSCLEESDIVKKPVTDFGVKLMISAHPNTRTFVDSDELLMKIADEKFKTDLETGLIPLNNVQKWKRTAYSIHHEDKKFFEVIGVRVQAAKREVLHWDQPILLQHSAGLVGFIAKEINGVMHFLIQLKMESGVMDLLEISPTVQCITGNYSKEFMPLYVPELVDRKGFETLVDTYQSEEGGRFFQESNRNIVLLADDNFKENENSKYLWMSLRQLKDFIKFNNFLNVEARSVLACMQWS